MKNQCIVVVYSIAVSSMEEIDCSQGVIKLNRLIMLT